MKIRGYGDFQTTRMTHVHYLIKSYHFPSLFQLPKKKKKKKKNLITRPPPTFVGAGL